MDCIYINIESMLCTVKENMGIMSFGKSNKNNPHGKKMTPDRASAYGQESCVRLGLYHQ